MDCRTDDWVCEAIDKVGLHGFSARTAQFLLQHPLRIVMILVLAGLASRLGSRLARRSVVTIGARSRPEEGSPRFAQRAKTLSGVAANMVRVVVWAVAGLLLLGELGLDLGPFVAGASVVGVALGFGAQSLVKDFLSGFFILAEDQYGVGDTITIMDVAGEVEDVSLRVTRIRSIDGTVWFIPNGEIRKVGNQAKEWSRAIIDVVVPSDADLTRVTAAITEEAAAFCQDEAWRSAVLDAPEVLGVEVLDKDSVTLRVSTRTVPKQRARVARALRTRIVARLQRDGVEAAQAAGSDNGGDDSDTDPADDESSG